MQTFFTSDLHLGHKNVIALCERPFHSLEDMHSILIANWNRVVKKDDLVWVLGDFSFSSSTVTKQYLSELQGRKILVQGNHDKGGPLAYLAAGFELVLQRATIKLSGRTVHLSHYPYKLTPEEQQDADSKGYKVRYAERRMQDESEWLLHGHVHSQWKTKRRMINVGVDVWNFTPVCSSIIESLIHSAVVQQ